KRNIKSMFANLLCMVNRLTGPRFLWLASADALLFHWNNPAAVRSNRDYKGFYPAEERLLKRYLAEGKLAALPSTLGAYLKQVVTPTLERQKQNGAVAIKYEAAYLRKLDFDDPDETVAAATYARYVRGGEPPPHAYKALQDFLFYYMARECARLGLAVHIHCIEGAGGFYRQSGSNALLLEAAFNDPALRKTNFLVIHGGDPFTKQIGAVMSKTDRHSALSGRACVRYPCD